MTQEISTRKYHPHDARALADIFYHTIHFINIRDYSEEQVNAWAPKASLVLENWKTKWSKLAPIVAVCNHTVVGFAEFEPNGHIDCFYVHHEYQNKGVGAKLIAAIELEAQQKNILRIYAEVSITAKPFFEKKGFKVTKQQTVVIRGCELINFVMEKLVSPDKSMSLQRLKNTDIPIMVKAFQQANWPKPSSTFETYYQEQLRGERLIWVAYLNNQFAGYVTLKWHSLYEPFANANIPEIMDLNVLPDFRKMGIGSKLLEIAEKKAEAKCDRIGIGVGLYGGPDGGYGAAQKLYIKRGYIPDGNGVTYNYKPAEPGRKYPLDDDLILWFNKKLR